MAAPPSVTPTLSGVIVVDKPAGMTSHDVVNRLRRLTGIRKIGHLGTLDPFATGVLPLMIGRVTRLAQFFVRNDKVYEGVIRFGCATDTYDRDGKPASVPVAVTLDPADVQQRLSAFVGCISQVPPPVSAKKVGGVPAYKLARKNLPVELAPVNVEIYSIDLLWCEGNQAGVRVHCSAGTYVRAIAHELGQAIGTGAFLDELRRTASGGFDLSMGHTLEKLGELAADGRLEEALIPGGQLLPEFPSERVNAETAGQIRQGRDFRTSPFRAHSDARYIKAVTDDGQLIAIGEVRLPHVYHPILVL